MEMKAQGEDDCLWVEEPKWVAELELKSRFLCPRRTSVLICSYQGDAPRRSTEHLCGNWKMPHRRCCAFRMQMRAEHCGHWGSLWAWLNLCQTVGRFCRPPALVLPQPSFGTVLNGVSLKAKWMGWVQPLWGPRGEHLSNLSTHTPFDPAVPLLGICSRYIHKIFQDFYIPWSSLPHSKWDAALSGYRLLVHRK